MLAIPNHSASLMWFSRCGGGIHSTYFRKNAFNSKTKQSITMKAH